MIAKTIPTARRFPGTEARGGGGSLDLDAMIAGAAAGGWGFVVDPSSDGARQIAALLAADNLVNLSPLAIVGHGSAARRRSARPRAAADLAADSAAQRDRGGSGGRPSHESV